LEPVRNPFHPSKAFRMGRSGAAQSGRGLFKVRPTQKWKGTIKRNAFQCREGNLPDEGAFVKIATKWGGGHWFSKKHLQSKNSGNLPADKRWEKGASQGGGRQNRPPKQRGLQ